MTEPDHAELDTLIEQNIRLQARVTELEAAMREIVIQSRIDPELLDSRLPTRGGAFFLTFLFIEGSNCKKRKSSQRIPAFLGNMARVVASPGHLT